MTDKKSEVVIPAVKKTDVPATASSKVEEPIKKGLGKKASSTNNVNKNTIQPKKTAKKNLPKTAIFSLFLAVIAIAGVVASFFYMQQQQSEVVAKLTKENNAALKDYQQRFKKGLKAQQSQFTLKIKQTADELNTSIEASRKKELSALSDSVSTLQKSIQNRQPSDWLIHEAEYLIRLASRSLWMEKDTTATINLLKEADARLVELNAPFLLPIRQLIHEDIKSLEAMPQLATDYIVLTLMALNKGVPTLPLAFDNLDTNQNDEEDLSLTESVDDWESNLQKSWTKFFNNFIRVRNRTGSVEPLMSPNEQVNLKNNLSLKIQLAIWAASQRKTDVYSQSLNNVELWLNSYFDMDANINKKFINDIIQLQQKMVNYDYPSDLASLTAIRKALKERTLATASPVKNTVDKNNGSDKATVEKKAISNVQPLKEGEL